MDDVEINRNATNVIEFNFILQYCKTLLICYQNYRVSFIGKQTNFVSH